MAGSDIRQFRRVNVKQDVVITPLGCGLLLIQVHMVEGAENGVKVQQTAQPLAKTKQTSGRCWALPSASTRLWIANVWNKGWLRMMGKATWPAVA